MESQGLTYRLCPTGRSGVRCGMTFVPPGRLGASPGLMEPEGPAYPVSVGSFGSNTELFLMCDMLTVGYGL